MSGISFNIRAGAGQGLTVGANIKQDFGSTTAGVGVECNLTNRECTAGATVTQDLGSSTTADVGIRFRRQWPGPEDPTRSSSVSFFGSVETPFGTLEGSNTHTTIRSEEPPSDDDYVVLSNAPSSVVHFKEDEVDVYTCPVELELSPNEPYKYEKQPNGDLHVSSEEAENRKIVPCSLTETMER